MVGSILGPRTCHPISQVDGDEDKRKKIRREGDGRGGTHEGDADDVGVDDVDEAGGLEDEDGTVEGLLPDLPPGHLPESGGGAAEEGSDAAPRGRHWARATAALREL